VVFVALADVVAFFATVACLRAGVEEAVVTGWRRLCGLAGVAASEEQPMARITTVGRITLCTPLYCRTIAMRAGGLLQVAAGPGVDVIRGVFVFGDALLLNYPIMRDMLAAT
jgi:hypothetical protein